MLIKLPFVKFSLKLIPVMMIVSILLWGYLFKGFISGDLALQSDATSYYDHTRFFVDYIREGVYPMWDHTWRNGIPNELFLRRIGAYNPFYYVIILFQCLGIPYTQAYLLFIAFYFILGVLGFYWIALRIFNDDSWAFLSFLLVLFSSLASRLFASYIILMFVPLMWFFAFGLDCWQRKKISSFIGMTFCGMILMTTYVPFHFITILLTFLFCFICIYPQKSFICLREVWVWASKNRCLVGICACLIVMSVIPGLLFLLEGKQAEIVMPVRNMQAVVDNVLGVSERRIEPGIFAHIKFDQIWSNLDKIKLKLFYIPFFSYLLLMWGAFAGSCKRTVFWIAWIFLLLLMASPEIASLHEFLFEHVFYFKYFRNFRYLLWIIILPVFILFVVDVIRGLCLVRFQAKIKKPVWLMVVTGLHAIVLGVLLWQGNVLISTYLTVILGWIFLLFFIQEAISIKSGIFVMWIFILVVIEPIEVFSFLAMNSQKQQSVYSYDRDFKIFHYVEEDAMGKSVSSYQKHKKKSVMYIASAKYEFLINHLNNGDVFSNYIRHKFILYDDVKPMQDLAGIKFFEEALGGMTSVAVIANEPQHQKESLRLRGDQKATFINGDEQEVRVVAFDANKIKLDVEVKDKKFLVYNDAYHSEWQAKIDGQLTEVYRANIAFKGIWIPAGRHTIVFWFGSPWRYVLNYALIIIFGGVFGWYGYAVLREREQIHAT